MVISGKYGGISRVDFDWLEEGACIDCVPSAYEDEGDLVWSCDICGGGRANLESDHADRRVAMLAQQPDGSGYYIMTN